MKSKLLGLVILLFCSFAAHADDDVTFTVTAPSTVIMNRPFQITYTANVQRGGELRLPEITDFDVLAGPFTSFSTSIVNGNRTSTSTYTYTLLAKKTGKFSISSANFTYKNKKYTSKGLTIEVLPADNPSTTSSGAGSPSSNAGQTNNSGTVGGNDVFVRAIVSKRNVLEQEAILVTYKLYTLVDVASIANAKFPDFNGFMKQDIELSRDNQTSYENYNGRNYGTIVLYQTLIYPQRSGELQIEPATFEAIIRVRRKSQMRSIFDDFFDTYDNVSKNLTAPAVKITVNPLPAGKPAGFSGFVGSLALNSSISAKEINANEAVTLKLNVSGNGNLKMLKNPELVLPQGFELFDPKVVNNFSNTTSGVSGTKNIEYVFIPRHAGDFEIPPVQLSFFDLKENKYKTLTTPTYRIKVNKDGTSESNASAVVGGSYIAKEDVKHFGSDIRYIQTQVNFVKEDEPMFGSLFGWLLYLAPASIALLVFIVLRKQAQDNANIGLMKNKKANKVAQKRLKVAQKCLNAGKKDQFYEEVLKAVWTYLSDKLLIPVSALARENVEKELEKREVDEALITRLLEILNTCEFARYAPNSGQQEMGNLYNETIQLVSELEGKIKR